VLERRPAAPTTCVICQLGNNCCAMASAPGRSGIVRGCVQLNGQSAPSSPAVLFEEYAAHRKVKQTNIAFQWRIWELNWNITGTRGLMWLAT
jgi:hypothetical protein